MKRIVVCTLCVFMLLILIGCSAEQTVSPQSTAMFQVDDTFGRFVVMDVEFIGDSVYHYTMYDSETYAMYVYISRGYQQCTMVPLYNTDGSVMINMELAAVG